MKRDATSGRPLHRWPAGARLRVLYIRTAHPGGSTAAARKLAALGILPGSAITLVQTAPLPVVAIGNSVFAIDRGAAAAVICVQDPRTGNAGPGDVSPRGE